MMSAAVSSGPASAASTIDGEHSGVQQCCYGGRAMLGCHWLENTNSTAYPHARFLDSCVTKQGGGAKVARDYQDWRTIPVEGGLWSIRLRATVKGANQRFRTPCVLWTRVALVVRWTLLLEAEETQMQCMTLPAPRQTCFKAVTTAHHVVVARSESVAKRIGQARVCVCDLLRSFALLPPFSICFLSFSPLCTRDATCNPNTRPLFL